MMIQIFSIGSTTTVELINGQPDLSSFQEPTKAILRSAFDADSYEVIPALVPQPIVPQPNPMGFRSKLYGLTGTENNSLYGVYAETTAIAVTPATANAALTESRNILEGSFWNEPFSKPAFAAAYNILKNFLTPEQIAICDAAIIEFNLI